MSFRLTLWLIGQALAIASRLSPRVRGQLSRDMTLVIASADGVARSFTIAGRRLTSRAAAAPDAVCTLWFRSAALGRRVLLAPNAIERLVDGLGSGDVVCKGEAAVVLWFYELAMGLLPWRRRPADAWPESYVAPDPGHRVFGRIRREGVVGGLDPRWTAAHAQRDKLLIWQVGRGAAPAGKVTTHKVVVDVGAGCSGERE